MEALLAHGAVQATVSRTDWPVWAEANPVMGASPRFRALVGRRRCGRRTRAAAAPTRPRPAAGPGRGRARAAEVAEHLRRRMAKILGAAPERVDTGAPLTELGMDSLMAVELMTALKNDFMIDVPGGQAAAGRDAGPAQAKRDRAPGPDGAGAAPARCRIGGCAPAADPGVGAGRDDAGRRRRRARDASAAAVPAQRRSRMRRHPPTKPTAARASTPRGHRLRVDRLQPLDAGAAHRPRRWCRAWCAPWPTCESRARSTCRPSGPVLIAANHLSMWDAPVLLRYAERRTVIFAAEELRQVPLDALDAAQAVGRDLPEARRGRHGGHGAGRRRAARRRRDRPLARGHPQSRRPHARPHRRRRTSRSAPARPSCPWPCSGRSGYRPARRGLRRTRVQVRIAAPIQSRPASRRRRRCRRSPTA